MNWEQNGGGLGILNRPVVSASLHIQRTKGIFFFKEGNEGGGGERATHGKTEEKTGE